MKVLFLVLSHNTTDETFTNFETIWRKKINLFESNNTRVDVKFLKCSNSTISGESEKQNEIICHCNENYWKSLLDKVISGFEFFLENDYDLVFKTNLSTVVNIKPFLSYCELVKNKEFVYDGVFSEYQDYLFCSGAGMLLNKNTVKIVLSNKKLINDSWTDDIFIGYVLHKLNNITPTYNGLTRLDIITPNFNVDISKLNDFTHFRFKVRDGHSDIYNSNKIFDLLYSN
jgi:hypothetical protein